MLLEEISDKLKIIGQTTINPNLMDLKDIIDDISDGDASEDSQCEMCGNKKLKESFDDYVKSIRSGKVDKFIEGVTNFLGERTLSIDNNQKWIILNALDSLDIDNSIKKEFHSKFLEIINEIIKVNSPLHDLVMKTINSLEDKLENISQ